MVSKELQEKFAAVGARVPRILLPARGVDLEKFSVIACDQYSADAAYWEAVEKTVGGAPSSLRMMLPEAWLKDAPADANDEINRVMRDYCMDGVLTDIGECLVYVRRQTSGGIRRGLVIALDLEEYDYTKDASGLIRATEATVVERLPARIEIRRHAPLEMPHIMVLLDDKTDALMGALESSAANMQTLYDFDLMQNGGHITGYRVDDEVVLSLVAEELTYLRDISRDGLLYAMGDGNHSFAAAKACWEEIKAALPEEAWKDCPARYCLCELVNLYDPALHFEPIHRALLGVDPKAVQKEIGFDANKPPLLQRLQPMLDIWLKKHPEAELEYIHGEEACRKLCDAPDRLAVILPDFDKESLFETVRRDGAFVRKSFSMGHADDKRFYLECRRIQE